MRRRLLSVVAGLSIVSALSAQDADLRSKINDALDMARPALVDHLKASSKRGVRPGELALVLLAALHDGVPLTSDEMHAAINRLAKAKPAETYDIALRLLVLEACPTFPDREKIARRDTKLLLSHRSSEGCFQYRKKPSTWDLSNTQYGALGLRAARAMGEKIRDDVWIKLAREIGEQQNSYGGWRYAPRAHGIKDGYASMTAAGIAVLAICREALGEKHRRHRMLTKQIDRGWGWFHKNIDPIGSPKEHWSFYFHYGLERAAILCDVTKINGQHDWYVRGAKMLLEEQLSGGGWTSAGDGFPGGHLSNKRGDAVPTSFAILFLRRKFQKLSGPVTGGIVRLVNIGPQSKDKDIRECSKQLIARGKDAMKDVLNGLRSEVANQRAAAVEALRSIAGDDFGFDPQKDRDANRSALRKAELWYLRNR